MGARPPRDDSDPFASPKGRAGWSGTAQPPPPGPPLPPGSPGGAVPPPPVSIPSPPPPSGYPSAGGYSSPPPPPSGGWGASDGKNWMGILSLVLGCTCVASGLIGAIFGHLGLAACKRGEANNPGIALAGVIVNYAVIGLAVIGISIYVAGGGSSPSSTPTHTSGFATQGTEATQTPESDDLASHPLDTTLSVSRYWYDLTVGDCVTNFYSDEEPVDGNYLYEDPTIVPCSEPHYGEVYALAGIGGVEPPSDETFQTHLEQLCQGSAFATYVGVSDYFESEIYYDVLYPSDLAWEDGGREMVCLLVEEDETTIGSLRGSGL